MSTFVAVNDKLLSQRIVAASRQIVFIAPAVSKTVALALGECFEKAGRVSITVVLDPDQDAYRVGYGDPEGLEKLQQLAEDHHIALRSQPGLRIGILLSDDAVLVWSPTPRAVEGQRGAGEANGVDLGAAIEAAPRVKSSEDRLRIPTDELASPTAILSDAIRNAVAADDTDVILSQAEIGRAALTPEQVTATLEILKKNPPAPFDLARKTRVFSTKFQFVEAKLRGAQWTNREIKLSSLLLNPDVPDELQDLFETRIKPFSSLAGLAVEVPVLVQGQIAYSREGNLLLAPMTQTEIERAWEELLKLYLVRLEGFGLLIRRAQKGQFEADVAAYETMLKAWVEGFRIQAANEEAQLVTRVVNLINVRANSHAARERLRDINIKKAVVDGIRKLRVTDPAAKLIFKEISWESTRDAEFTEVLGRALPEPDVKEWFEVFTAARQAEDA